MGSGLHAVGVVVPGHDGGLIGALCIGVIPNLHLVKQFKGGDVFSVMRIVCHAHMINVSV